MPAVRHRRSCGFSAPLTGRNLEGGPNGGQADNGVSVWFDGQPTLAKMTRGKHDTLLRLVPDGATVEEESG